MDMSIQATSLVGSTGDKFSQFVNDLGQATMGKENIPAGYNTDTVKSIASSKANQDLYDQTFATNEHNSDKMAKMNGTENIDIYNKTGIKSAAELKGSRIDISI